MSPLRHRVEREGGSLGIHALDDLVTAGDLHRAVDHLAPQLPYLLGTLVRAGDRLSTSFRSLCGPSISALDGPLLRTDCSNIRR